MFDTNSIKKTDIVFLGDSLTEGFDLVKHFGRADLRNRGLSGNMTDHVVYRLEEIVKAKPKKVLLMIGINDLFQGKYPEEVFDNIVQILELIYQGSPDTWRYMQSVLPINESHLLMDEDLNTSIYKLNDMLAGYCLDEPRLRYVDLHTEFLGMNGQMDERYTFDGVHLSQAGYRLWKELVLELL